MGGDDGGIGAGGGGGGGGCYRYGRYPHHHMSRHDELMLLRQTRLQVARSRYPDRISEANVRSWMSSSTIASLRNGNRSVIAHDWRRMQDEARAAAQAQSARRSSSGRGSSSSFGGGSSSGGAGSGGSW